MKSYINDQDFIDDFKSIIDIERVVSKIGNLKVNPRELVNLKLSLEKVLLIKIVLLVMEKIEMEFLILIHRK